MVAASRWQVAAGLGTVFAVTVLLWRRRRLSALRISALYVFPVKSCRGVRVAEAQLTPDGLRHDRAYCVAEVSTGEAVVMTARKVPQLALISPSISEEGLILRKEGSTDCVVAATSGRTRRINMLLTGDADGEDMGEDAAAWLREALGVQGDVRLFRFVASRVADAAFGEGSFLGSDGFSVLVTSEASLSLCELRSGLAHAAERMRPNIVLMGCDAHEEDRWERLTWERGCASAQLALVKPCGRCIMPSVDPCSGSFGADPLRYLKPYRSGRELEKADTFHSGHFGRNRGDIFFGVNANTVVRGEVTLHVGDVLTSSPWVPRSWPWS